jgi:hypothetical protein
MANQDLFTPVSAAAPFVNIGAGVCWTGANAADKISAFALANYFDHAVLT